MKLYNNAIFWIAHNDADGDDWALDPSEVENMMSVLLVADVFKKEPLVVARAVVKERKENHPEIKELMKNAEKWERSKE